MDENVWVASYNRSLLGGRPNNAPPNKLQFFLPKRSIYFPIPLEGLPHLNPNMNKYLRNYLNFRVCGRLLHIASPLAREEIFQPVTLNY